MVSIALLCTGSKFTILKGQSGTLFLKNLLLLAICHFPYIKNGITYRAFSLILVSRLKFQYRDNPSLDIWSLDARLRYNIHEKEVFILMHYVFKFGLGSSFFPFSICFSSGCMVDKHECKHECNHPKGFTPFLLPLYLCLGELVLFKMALIDFFFCLSAKPKQELCIAKYR